MCEGVELPLASLDDAAMDTTPLDDAVPPSLRGGWPAPVDALFNRFFPAIAIAPRRLGRTRGCLVQSFLPRIRGYEGRYTHRYKHGYHASLLLIPATIHAIRRQRRRQQRWRQGDTCSIESGAFCRRKTHSSKAWSMPAVTYAYHLSSYGFTLSSRCTWQSLRPPHTLSRRLPSDEPDSTLFHTARLLPWSQVAKERKQSFLLSKGPERRTSRAARQSFMDRPSTSFIGNANCSCAPLRDRNSCFFSLNASSVMIPACRLCLRS